MVDSVIFRLPGDKDSMILKPGKGNDVFLMAPFEKSLKPIRLKGKIAKAGLIEIQEFFSEFDLEAAPDVKSVSKEEYRSLVDKALLDIHSGAFSKVVLAGRFIENWNSESQSLYDTLLQHYPDAFVYMIHSGSLTMLGASPETLLSKQADKLKTEALGGTPATDEYGDKEWIEHLQIRDYIAEKLEQSGYAYVKNKTYAKQAGNIEHLCTGFEMQSSGTETDLRLAETLHPTSAVCGLPFEKALEFIRNHEGFSRNYYSGYLGPVFENGDFHFFVNLRCAECYKGHLLLYAGAGINSMSVTSDEWNEINKKKQTIAQWLK